jgi:hypothetical protein
MTKPIQPSQATAFHVKAIPSSASSLTSMTLAPIYPRAAGRVRAFLGLGLHWGRGECRAEGVAGDRQVANGRTGVRWTVLAAGTSVAVLAGCGAGPAEPGTAATPSPTTTSTASAAVRGPQQVELLYLLKFENEDEGPVVVRYHVITDGGTRVRLKTSMYDPDGRVVSEEYLLTWDGSRILEFSEQNEVPYTVYEAPDEHPDQLEQVKSWRKLIWSTAPAPGCTDLKTTKTIIGRSAAGYRCVEPTPEPGQPAEGEVWVDQATGILLQAQFMVAEKLVLDPKITATTYSTEPPAGAKSIVIAPEKAPTGQKKEAPDFTLELVKGGRIGLKDLAGKPFVLAFFSSDLVFDENGEVFPGSREALLTLQSLTSNGTKPRVLAVQEGSLGKPGYPFVVPGLTLPLAHEETPTVNGLFALASFVFVRADGTIAASYDRPPTKQQLTQSVAALR